MKIITVKFGEKYDGSLVNKFLDYGDVFCYTDNKRNISNSVTVIEPIDGHNYKNKLFYKLHLFSPQMPDEQFLYMDLDINIYGDVKKLLREDFTLIYSYWRPISEMTKYTRTMLNSGIMSWRNKPVEIFDYFINNQEEVFTYWPGIDPFIDKMRFNYNVYEENLISMKNKWTIKPIAEVIPKSKR